MSGASARIAWLDGPGELVWREEALEVPGYGEVLCETVVSAISPGTELAAWRAAPPLRPGNPYPRVQGYCNVAKVLSVGEGFESLAPGDHVLTLQSHRSHFTLKASDTFCRVPEGAALDRVAAAYLFHLGYNASLRSDVRPGHRVAVIGLGALGLTSVAMAKQAGAEVHAISDHDAPSAIAKGYGAAARHTRAEAEGLAGETGPDVIILTTNSWEDMALAQRIARKNAMIACLGFPGREQPPGDYNPLAAEHFYNKQLRIEAVGASPLENDARGFNRFNVRDNLAFLVGRIADGTLDAAPLLSGRYRASDLAQAYEDLATRKDNAITYLLDWTE